MTMLPYGFDQAEEREGDLQQGRLLEGPDSRADSDPAHPSTPPQVPAFGHPYAAYRLCRSCCGAMLWFSKV
jgi:hypothetical protein